MPQGEPEELPDSRSIMEETFYFQWAVLRRYTRPYRWRYEWFLHDPDFPYFGFIEAISRARSDFREFQNTWEEIFDFSAIYRVIESDFEANPDERSLVREYHLNNLTHLSRAYAFTVYRISGHGESLDSQILRKAFRQMKVALACPIYPCEK
jgi:hypothetical protein